MKAEIGSKLPNVGTVDEAVGIAASTKMRNNTIKLAKLFIAFRIKYSKQDFITLSFPWILQYDLKRY